MKTYAGVLATCIAVLGLLVGCGSDETTIRGRGDRILTVSVPSGVEVERGDTEDVQIDLERQNVSGGIEVSLSGLPEGVTAREMSKTVETDSATFVLKADESAALVQNQVILVTVRAPDGMSATKQFRLTVEP